MRKTDKDYRSYIVATEKPNDCLQGINRLGGRIYSKTVSLTQETHAKKGFWLSDSGLKKYLKFKDYPCHAHSVQAIIDDYCGARHSFFGNLKSNPNARPPFKRKWYHTFTWRASGITYKPEMMGTQAKARYEVDSQDEPIRPKPVRTCGLEKPNKRALSLP